MSYYLRNKGGSGSNDCLQSVNEMNSGKETAEESSGGINAEFDAMNINVGTPPQDTSYYGNVACSTPPPRKAWEWHYRSFLSRMSPSPASPRAMKEKARAMTDTNMQRHHQKNMQHHKAPPCLPAMECTSSSKDELDVNRKQAKASMPPATILRQRSDPPPPSSSDASVRGGSLFKGMFKNKKKKEDSSSGSSGRFALDQDHSVPPLRHKIKRGKSSSYDALDESLRKGLRKTANSDLALTSTPRPLTLGNRSSSTGSCNKDERNVHLDTALRGANSIFRERSSSAAIGSKKTGDRSKEMKIAFTEFHNSTKDTVSAYLGDEPSAHRDAQFFNLMYGRGNVRRKIPSYHQHGNFFPPATLSASAPLDKLDEEVAWSSIHLLYPVEGIDSWRKGQTHLMAPAALSMCPLPVISSLFCGGIIRGKTPQRSNNHRSGLSLMMDAVNPPSLPVDEFDESTTIHVEPAQSQPPPSFPFRKEVMENVLVAVTGPRKLSDDNYSWTRATFVLRHNYLLEYGDIDSIKGMPRGIAHLQNSVILPHHNFLDVLHLEFDYHFTSMGGIKKNLLLRLGTQKERNRWVYLLRRAANMDVKDLYDVNVFGQSLGSGRFATVYPARRKSDETKTIFAHKEIDEQRFSHSHDNKNSSQNKLSPPSLQKYNCALKIINKDLFWERVNKGKERTDTLVRELAVQATLTIQERQVPTMLQLRDFLETKDKIILELELLQGNDLFSHISSKRVLSEPEAAHIIRDILYSLDAMCRCGVAHRDIKPANILICDVQNLKGVAVKLGDYGMSTFVGVDNLIHGRCGTPGYVAPEILSAGVNSGYTNFVDMFSAGVVLYVLLCGYEPFYGKSDAELVAVNKEANLEFPDSDWSTVSEAAKDLIKCMMDKDPLTRISPQTALKHSWILKYAPPAPWEARNSTGETSTEVTKLKDPGCMLS